MRARACPPTSQMGLCQGSSLVPVLCCFGGLESLTPSLEQNMPWPAQPLLSIATHSYPLKLPNRALLQASSLLADFPCFLLESPLPRPENKTTVLLRHPNIPLGVGTAYPPKKLPNRALFQASSLLAHLSCFLLESPIPRLDKLLVVGFAESLVGIGHTPKTHFATWHFSRAAAFWLISLAFYWKALYPGLTKYFLLVLLNPL